MQDLQGLLAYTFCTLYSTCYPCASLLMIVLEIGFLQRWIVSCSIPTAEESSHDKKQGASHLDCTLWHPPALSRLPLEPIASQDLVARALRVLPPPVAEHMST